MIEWLNKLRTSRDVWSIYAKSRIDSAYHFSTKDCQLHISERLWRTPPVNVCSDLGAYYRLAIRQRELFWPKSLNFSGLSWIHEEVFAPWAVNPSSYDHPETQVPGNGWVIDAGACEGFFSMHALEKHANRVVAVEPLEVLASTLRMTFAEAECDGRLTVLNRALGSNHAVAYLQSEVGQVWDSTVRRASQQSGDVPVETVTIDEVVTFHGFSGQGLIKMDIEGSEMSALQGATVTMQKCKPRLAIAVYHEYKNALLCRDIIMAANPEYHIEFRGMYAWFLPPRPYLLFAW